MNLGSCIKCGKEFKVGQRVRAKDEVGDSCFFSPIRRDTEQLTGHFHVECDAEPKVVIIRNRTNGDFRVFNRGDAEKWMEEYLDHDGNAFSFDAYEGRKLTVNVSKTVKVTLSA